MACLRLGNKGPKSPDSALLSHWCAVKLNYRTETIALVVIIVDYLLVKVNITFINIPLLYLS